MEHRYITVAYKLSTKFNGEIELVEEAPEEHPFQFISGLEYTIEAFEQKVSALAVGENFTLTIPAEEAYGPFREEFIQTHPKSLFCDENGDFDTENIFVGNTIPLRDGEGQQFLAVVNNITDTEVELNFNHPLAGKDLIFEGKVVTNRPATPEEIEGAQNMMSGDHGGCGGGCCGHDDEEHQHSGCSGCCSGCH